MTFARVAATAALCLGIVAGLTLWGIELWHTFLDPAHQTERAKWIIGGVLVGFCAYALQKGDIGKAYTVVIDRLPIAIRRGSDLRRDDEVVAKTGDVTIAKPKDPEPGEA